MSQNYRKYTAEDQSVYRYIMKQLKSFLTETAYSPYYLKGLKETGITIDHIPRISDISKKLKPLGWQAVPVSGFIPPSAFMEFQLHSILPIASELRTANHISYTPAPDIVHEASGHTPFLIHPAFNSFLKKYAKVVIKAITNKQDFEQYSAIRHLSDIKENPYSSKKQIQQAERRLKHINSKMKAVSEASSLSRFIWWTSEYGLIGKPKSPKIYGAGLLSSIGEAKACLNQKVKKIPLSPDCVQYAYDITKYQPQLFVTPDFETLHKVLDELSKKCAFYQGGEDGLKKAKEAKTVCTVELETGLQISGILENYIQTKKQTAFLKLKGPCQLSFKGHQLKGHGINTHSHGYSSPLCRLKGEDTPLHQIPLSELKQKYTHKKTGQIKLEFHSQWVLEGQYVSAVLSPKPPSKARPYKPEAQPTFSSPLGYQYPLLIRFKNCRVYRGDKVYYQPEWGVFDLALGEKVSSVFGGPADRLSYGEKEHFKVARVLTPTPTLEQKKVFAFYRKIRKLRESHLKSQANRHSFNKLMEEYLGLVWQKPAISRKPESATPSRKKTKGLKSHYLIGVELWELAHKFRHKNAQQTLKQILLKIDKQQPQLMLKNFLNTHES